MDIDVTELVEDFRSPIKETESRLPLRWSRLVDEVIAVDDWRGGRDVSVDGDPRIDDCLVGPATTLGVVPSSPSMTPNSLVEKDVGEEFADGPNPVVWVLARRFVKPDAECFNGGEEAADVRLEIRGIFVGVSFGRPMTLFVKDEGGSLPSFKVCELFVPFVPTEGEPAMVGN